MYLLTTIRHIEPYCCVGCSTFKRKICHLLVYIVILFRTDMKIRTTFFSTSCEFVLYFNRKREGQVKMKNKKKSKGSEGTWKTYKMYTHTVYVLFIIYFVETAVRGVYMWAWKDRNKENRQVYRIACKTHHARVCAARKPNLSNRIVFPPRGLRASVLFLRENNNFTNLFYSTAFFHYDCMCPHENGKITEINRIGLQLILSAIDRSVGFVCHTKENK